MDQRHELFAKLWFADQRPKSSGGCCKQFGESRVPTNPSGIEDQSGSGSDIPLVLWSKGCSRVSANSADTRASL
jgi:hypothetical protein